MTHQRMPLLALAAVLIATPAGAQNVLATRSVADLSIEELAQVVVTSVSRQPQALSEAAASVYVIHGEDIRRAGATTLPEALRLAPNLQVAALDARQYAITARGFSTNIANKLLVLIDGRAVYSPLFSGVFWDAQDVVLDDVERIEVISGPGGVTWGTNAVNGIINVITRSTADTAGTLATLDLGEAERAVSARHGAAAGDATHFRIYGKAFERDRYQLARPGTSYDAWHRALAGVRLDWRRAGDAVVLQAEAYNARSEDRPLYGGVKLTGAHVLGRWNRSLRRGDVEVQAYFDQTNRRDRFLLQERAHLFDVETKVRFASGEHRWVLGAGYRSAEDHSEPGVLFAFFPTSRDLDWYNAFAQYQYRITPSLETTLGARFEHNTYTGWETLPSLRLAWTAARDHLVWGALSRAVRSPARLDREIFFPTQPPFFIAGGPAFDSEVANIAELGYRGQPAASLTWSITGFVQDYDRLRSAQVTPQGPILIENRIEGTIRGIETWAQWQVLPEWRLSAGALFLDKDLRLKEGSNDPIGPGNLGNDAQLQWSLRSTHSLTERQVLEVGVRHVGTLPQPSVPSYTAVDARYGWQLTPRLELAVVIRNAFDSGHMEADPGPAVATEVPRSAWLEMRWRSR